MARIRGIVDDYTPTNIKDIPGYEGIYGITIDGQVWSHKRNWRRGRGVWLKQYDKKGYLTVKLCKYDRDLCRFVERYKRVNRLVAMAWIPTNKPFNKQQVNHKDGVKHNNHADNLEWNTARENTHHAINTGLRRSSGANNGNAKLTAEQVEEIRRRYIPRSRGFSYGNRKLLAKQFNINPATVNAIAAGRTHKELVI